MENLQSELAGGCSQCCELRKQYKQTSSGPERQREWWEFLQHLSMPVFRRPVSHQRFVGVGLLQLCNSRLHLPLIGFYHFSAQTQKESDWNVSISGTIDTKTAVQKFLPAFYSAVGFRRREQQQHPTTIIPDACRNELFLTHPCKVHIDPFHRGRKTVGNSI